MARPPHGRRRRAIWPPAADNLVVTPNATTCANSAWVQAVSATSAACLLAGVVVSPGVASVDYEIDIGTGGVGAETVIATVTGITAGSITGLAQSSTVLPLPIDAIANGVRVAVRLRKTGTSVADLGRRRPLLREAGSRDAGHDHEAVQGPAGGGGLDLLHLRRRGPGPMARTRRSRPARRRTWCCSAWPRWRDFEATRWEVDIAVGAAAAEVRHHDDPRYNPASWSSKSPNLVVCRRRSTPSRRGRGCRAAAARGQPNTTARAVTVRLWYRGEAAVSLFTTKPLQTAPSATTGTHGRDRGRSGPTGAGCSSSRRRRPT